MQREKLYFRFVFFDKLTPIARHLATDRLLRTERNFSTSRKTYYFVLLDVNEAAASDVRTLGLEINPRDPRCFPTLYFQALGKLYSCEINS